MKGWTTRTVAVALALMVTGTALAAPDTADPQTTEVRFQDDATDDDVILVADTVDEYVRRRRGLRARAHFLARLALVVALGKRRRGDQRQRIRSR